MVADMLEMDDRRFEAQTCLAAIGAPAEAEVIRMLGSKERRTVQGAIDVLAQIGGAKSVEALKKLGIDKVSAGADWERVKADADRTAALLESKLGG